jgi:Fe-S cluster assembly ATP-binding protein
MLEYVQPQFVHIMMDGRIVKSGSDELIEKIDTQGYEWLREEVLAGSGV